MAIVLALPWVLAVAIQRRRRQFYSAGAPRRSAPICPAQWPREQTAAWSRIAAKSWIRQKTSLHDVDRKAHQCLDVPHRRVLHSRSGC